MTNFFSMHYHVLMQKGCGNVSILYQYALYSIQKSKHGAPLFVDSIVFSSKLKKAFKE